MVLLHIRELNYKRYEETFTKNYGSIESRWLGVCGGNPAN